MHYAPRNSRRVALSSAHRFDCFLHTLHALSGPRIELDVTRWLDIQSMKIISGFIEHPSSSSMTIEASRTGNERVMRERGQKIEKLT